MIQIVMAVFDVKAKIYSLPFYAPSEIVGTRNVAAAVNDAAGEVMLSKFPEDFRLFRIGSFDDESGMFSQEEAPVFMCECSSLKRS